ncbi:diaminopimelate epimerase [Clostridium sp. BJN0001]|uniref:diaminopimelate epimerase n=1 Tax=Clostridium sp. BJN0001 TaxID=2930219 RepID=UPI001FD59073|nr:diaminopimelate epimerase [Clostridium sp. BJN0001]
MDFIKMQGAGNDFVFVQDIEDKIQNETELAVKLCNRHYGIGGDGLIIVRKSDKADARMIIINKDGSYANMCGNGIRCFGRYVYENGIVKSKKFKVETGDGIKNIEVITDKNDAVKYIRVFMGKPSFDGKDIPLNGIDKLFNQNVDINGKEYILTTVLVGVPHTIVIEKDIDFDVEKDGPSIEKFKLFKEGTNVNFVKVINNDTIRVRTWERGAGYTLACGTGCSASAYISKKLGLVNQNGEINVNAPGGKLIIEPSDEGIYMKGEAELVFKGKVRI